MNRAMKVKTPGMITPTLMRDPMARSYLAGAYVTIIYLLALKKSIQRLPI